MDIKKIVATYNDELIELRRYFHRHPEESGKEDATIAYINEYLKKLNLKTSEVKDGGLLGIIDSGKPGKTLLLRADVDALAINGQIEMPLEKTFWGALYGAFTDQFGIKWMVNCQLLDE